MEDKDLLATARERFSACVSAYSNNRALQLDDLRFFAASPDNGWQWPEAVKKSRENDTNGPRPCLTINKLPQHVRQITNEMRQNMPAVKVLPVDGKSDPEVAEIMNGIIRHIEYHSDAETAYDIASESQVVTGEGYWRVLTEYCDERTFDQDIIVQPIRNHESAYLEPYCDSVGSDARYAFITQDMKDDEFKQTFPTAKPIDWDSVGHDADYKNWFTTGDKTVRVAEYFYKDIVERELMLFANGMLAFADELTPEMKSTLGDPLKTRKVMAERIKWCKLNGVEILEKRDWAGKYIPVIRVVGNEVEVEGEIYYYGLVRGAKDAQRMYNYWTSQEAELLALAPKAPFIGAAGQFADYEQKWKTANTINHAYLEYNPVVEGGVMVPPPQRVAPPMPSAGILQAKIGAAEDIKGTTAQYNASLGDRSNETSGKAILARQREGDTANFHYIDNFARSKRYFGRMMVDLIPKIYDSKRIARIVAEDGETDQAMIDPEQQQAVSAIAEGVKSYNLNVGRYDVMVVTGPSYTTKRQEAAESMSNILQTNQNLWPMIGDLLVKNMDWPGAQEMSERLHKMLPPQLQDQKDGQQMPPQAVAAVQQAQMAMQAVQEKAQELQEIENKLKGEAASNVAQKAALHEERTRLEAEKKVLEANYQRIVAELDARQAQAACDEATKKADETQAQIERISLPAQGPDGQQQFMDVAQMMAQVLSHMQALIQQGASPKQKTARIRENPDGTFLMESLETVQ